MNREKANLSLPPSFSLQRKRKFNERRRKERGSRCEGEKENEGYEVEKGKRQERLLVYLEPCSKPSSLAHLQMRWRPTVHVCPCLCRRWESVGRPVLYCWKGTHVYVLMFVCECALHGHCSFSSYYVSKEKNKLWNHLSVYSFTHCSPYCKL